MKNMVKANKRRGKSQSSTEPKTERDREEGRERILMKMVVEGDL